MTSDTQPTIPQPRAGLLGEWDKFIGPGATAAENALILGSFAAGLALVAWRALALDLTWSVWQWLVTLVVGADVLAGAVTNATNTAKRWYHRPGQGARNHLGFIALHAVHLLLLALVFPQMTWTAVAVAYGYLIAAAVLVVFVPLYLQRPVALTAAIGGLLLAIYALPQLPALEWLFPVFYLKLLVAHLVPETAWPVS